jgi:glycosyltransferase involved in cell wall biosynthesis
MIYTSGLARLANGWLTLSPSTGDEVTRALPALARRPSAFVWHPPYDWKSPVSRAAARATLSYGADEVILAHVGLLRSYKGLTEFIEVFAAGDLPDTRLLLAGEVPSPEYGAELTKLAAATDRVAFQCGRLDVHAYNLRLQAADIFVAPYWHFLHSGALVHALCRGCVVVAPDAPFTRDLVAAVGGQWLVLFAEKVTTDSIAEARARAIDNRNGKPDLTRLRPEANLSWLTSFVSSL